MYKWSVMLNNVTPWILQQPSLPGPAGPLCWTGGGLQVAWALLPLVRRHCWLVVRGP